jgi:hypothetical protein
MDLEKHAKLLKELQKDCPSAVLDGAVNDEAWSRQSTRLLWVLKETNDFSGDLRLLLGNPVELCLYKHWQATYGLVAKASYGLLTGKWVEDAEMLVKDERIFQKIAIVNVNKVGGHSTASHSELVKAAERFHDVIMKQIEFLDPAVVILGGVGTRLLRGIPKTRTVVTMYHPNQRTITHRQYYDRIVKQLEHKNE